MKAKINKNACIGCGSCAAICPEVFEIDDEGIAKVTVESINENQLNDATEASENCPTSAIEIEK